MQEGPYFDELAVGQEFAGAPGLTLTTGLAAAHQAITGDRLALAIDHELCRQVTGGAPLPDGGGLVHLRSLVQAEAPDARGGLGWPSGAITPSGLGWPGAQAGASPGGPDQHEGSAPRDVLDWRYIAVVA